MHDKEILKFVFKSDCNNEEYELFYNKNIYYFNAGGEIRDREFLTFQEALKIIKNELSKGDQHLRIESITSTFTTFEHV
tara:strand:- start:104 stop:340 length:237 start_codon:yes stop_codon:yes gene_type:complete